MKKALYLFTLFFICNLNYGFSFNQVCLRKGGKIVSPSSSKLTKEEKKAVSVLQSSVSREIERKKAIAILTKGGYIVSVQQSDKGKTKSVEMYTSWRF